jgi:ferritin-like metal-binding protein YciE
MEPKPWASNEIAYVQEKVEEVEKLLNESEQLVHNVEHVSNQLIKRFDPHLVHHDERKRKLKRAKEQRSKAKKKRETVAMSKLNNQTDGIDSSTDSEEVVDILDEEL